MRLMKGHLSLGVRLPHSGQELIAPREQEQKDLQQFLKNARKYTDLEELTAELLNDLVIRSSSMLLIKAVATENKR